MYFSPEAQTLDVLTKSGNTDFLEKVKNMRRISLVLGVCLLLSCVALAQTKRATKPTGIQSAPTTCGADPVLSSDGTDSPQDLLSPATSAFYTLNAKAGHSYSIEVWDVLDQTAAVAPTIQLLASDCMTSVASMDVTGVDPDLSQGFADRISWIQNSNATINIQASNPDQNNPYVYQIRVTDTTLYSPRFSTYGGYVTSWGFTNTTASSLTGTLTVVDTNGSVLATAQLTLPGNTGTFKTTTDLNVPANHAGSVIFAYVGPAGGVVADGFMISPSGNPILPVLFVGKHSYR